MIFTIGIALLLGALGVELGVLLELNDKQFKSEGFFPQGGLAKIDGKTWALILTPALMLGMVQYLTSLFDSAAWLSGTAVGLAIAAEAIYGFWMLTNVNRPRELVFSVIILAITFGMVKQALVSLSIFAPEVAAVLDGIAFWATVALVIAIAVSAAVSYYKTIAQKPAPVVPVLMAGVTLAVGMGLVSCTNDSQVLAEVVPPMTVAEAEEAGSGNATEAADANTATDTSATTDASAGTAEVQTASAEVAESSETQAVYGETGVNAVISDNDTTNNYSFGPAVDVSGMTPEQAFDKFLAACHSSVLTGTTAMATSDAVFGWNTLNCETTVNNVNSKMSDFYKNAATYQSKVDSWETQMRDGAEVSFVDNIDAKCMWGQFTPKVGEKPTAVLINCEGKSIPGPFLAIKHVEKGVEVTMYSRPGCAWQTLIAKVVKLQAEADTTPVQVVQRVQYVKAYCGGGRGDYSGGGSRVIVRQGAQNFVNNVVTNISNVINNTVTNTTTTEVTVNNEITNNNWYNFWYWWWNWNGNGDVPTPPTPNPPTPTPPTPNPPEPTPPEPTPPGPDQPIKDPIESPGEIGGNIEGEGEDEDTNTGVGSEESAADDPTNSGSLPSDGDYEGEIGDLIDANDDPNANGSNPNNDPTTETGADNVDSDPNTDTGNGTIGDPTDVTSDPATGDEVAQPSDDILEAALVADVSLSDIASGDEVIFDSGIASSDEVISGDEAIVEDGGSAIEYSDEIAYSDSAPTFGYIDAEDSSYVNYLDGGSSDEQQYETYDYTYDGGADTVTYDYTGGDYVDYNDYSVDYQGGDVLSFDAAANYADGYFELAA